MLPLLHPHPRQNSCPPHHLGLLVRKEHVSSCFLFPVFFLKDEDATEEAQLFKTGHMAKPGPDQNMAHSVSSTLTQLIIATNQNTKVKKIGKKNHLFNNNPLSHSQLLLDDSEDSAHRHENLLAREVCLIFAPSFVATVLNCDQQSDSNDYNDSYIDERCVAVCWIGESLS